MFPLKFNVVDFNNRFCCQTRGSELLYWQFTPAEPFLFSDSLLLHKLTYVKEI